MVWALQVTLLVRKTIGRSSPSTSTTAVTRRSSTGINFLHRRGWVDKTIKSSRRIRPWGPSWNLRDDAAPKVVAPRGRPKKHRGPPSRPDGRSPHRPCHEDDDFTRLGYWRTARGPVGFHASAAESTMAQRGRKVCKSRRRWHGGLAAAMFGPVEGAGHQLDGGGIHDMDEAFGNGKRISGGGCRQRRAAKFTVIQHGPEQLFGHLRVAGAISVGQRVFRRGRRRTQRRQRAGVKPQRVANVVEAEAVGQLGVKQTDDVAPGL